MIRTTPALLTVIVLAACGSAGGGTATKSPSTLTVFAASSLQPAFDKIGKQLQTEQNSATTFNYAGSQALVTQIALGAPADVFASADTTRMTVAEMGGLLAGSSHIFAHNRLEIAVERGNPKGIHSLADLARSGLVVVLADPSVPAGRYAQVALAKAHVTVHPASLELQVTGVLNKVALGDADAGIVYVSDIVTSGKVVGVAIPAEQNVIADYPIAVLNSAQNPSGASAFVAYVLSPDGQAILKAAGFQGV